LADFRLTAFEQLNSRIRFGLSLSVTGKHVDSSLNQAVKTERWHQRLDSIRNMSSSLDAARCARRVWRVHDMHATPTIREKKRARELRTGRAAADVDSVRRQTASIIQHAARTGGRRCMSVLISWSQACRKTQRRRPGRAEPEIENVEKNHWARMQRQIVRCSAT